MTEENLLRPAQAPWKLGLFSGSALKYFAAALMVLDHIHQMFLWSTAPGSTARSALEVCTMLGRLVMPIFLYMCAEGFHYTRNRKKYLFQLLVGFWGMNAVNLLLQRALPVHQAYGNVELMNNVFGTMFMSVVYMLAWSWFVGGIKERSFKKIAGGVGLAILPVVLGLGLVLLMGYEGAPYSLFLAGSFVPNLIIVEGDFPMVVLAVAFYAFRKSRLLQLLPLVILSALYLVLTIRAGGGSVQWMMIFAAIPLLFYNGRRGRGGAFSKYFFYVFYPAHIYALYLIAWFLQR